MVTCTYTKICLHIHTPKFPWSCCPRDNHWLMKSNGAFVRYPDILVAVKSECSVKWVISKIWTGTLVVQIQISRHSARRLIRICTACLNYRKLMVKWISFRSSFRTIFSAYTQRQSTHQSQLAFYVNLHRAVIGPSATLTGRWRPDIDLRRMLTGVLLVLWFDLIFFIARATFLDFILHNCSWC